MMLRKKHAGFSGYGNNTPAGRAVKENLKTVLSKIFLAVDQAHPNISYRSQTGKRMGMVLTGRPVGELQRAYRPSSTVKFVSC